MTTLLTLIIVGLSLHIYMDPVQTSRVTCEYGRNEAVVVEWHPSIHQMFCTDNVVDPSQPVSKIGPASRNINAGDTAWVNCSQGFFVLDDEFVSKWGGTIDFTCTDEPVGDGHEKAQP